MAEGRRKVELNYKVVGRGFKGGDKGPESGLLARLPAFIIENQYKLLISFL